MVGRREEALISALFPDHASDQDVEAGRLVLGRYTVLGKLTQGGMAEVYLARQKGPAGYSKLVVVKRVKPSLANDKDFVAMFVNEARLAALINHPNVVQIFDLGQDKRDWFLAMEFLDGRDMLQVGRACRALNKAVPFDVTARIIADACHGLDHAHRLVGADGKPLNLVHRDMSPENILITFEGQVKVVDFGIAKARDNAFRTQAGQIKGKLGYVAPEAILGKALDARADIFAIGATLYLFLCGRPAFTGSNPMEIFERSLQPPERPSKLNSRVPPMLEEICVKCLEKDPNNRFRTAGELRAALEEYLQSTGRPMGAPQMSQFMKILFPAEKDATRQRIEQLLAVGDAREERASAPVTATVPVALPGARSPSPPSYDEESEATAVVPPEQRPDHTASSGRTPSAVNLGSDEAVTERGPALRRTSTAEAKPAGYHLRSVELASQLDAKKPTPAPRREEPEATLTRPPAFLSEPDGRAERRGEMTVELDPSLVDEIRASGMGAPAPSGEYDLDLGLEPGDLDDDDDVDLAGIEVTNTDARVETAVDAPPPPLASDAFDQSIEVAPFAAEVPPPAPPPAAPPAAPPSAPDLDLSPALAASAPAVAPSGPGPSLSFDDGPEGEVAREVIVQRPSAAVRFGMLLAGMVTGAVLLVGGLWAFGELDWMAERLAAQEAAASDASSARD